MATNKSVVGKVISEVAHQEGGTTKGSTSAKMQSEATKTSNLVRDASTNTPIKKSISETMKAQGGDIGQSYAASEMQSNVTKQHNAEAAEAEVGSKLATAPETVTAEDAQYVKSREARVQGVAQPPKGSVGAQAESVASANEAGTRSKYATGTTEGPDPKTQGQLSREEAFAKVVEAIEPRMSSNPGQVTQEDARLLHSREVKAFGGAEKGGIAAQAQKLASKNEPK